MDINHYKQIISMAISNEIEAQEFYEKAAQKSKDPYLKSMFEEFVREEKKHADILKRILASDTIDRYFSETTDYKVAETVEAPAFSMDMKPADAIAIAMKKEEEAMKEYTKLAQDCPDPEPKRVFLDLAAMERDHKLKMEKAFVDVAYPEVW